MKRGSGQEVDQTTAEPPARPGGARRTRLRDVAELAGVSFKTVSNVVHGYRHVSPETRARVQDAIDQLGYRPNLSARHLRQGRAGLIAVALPDLRVPYFAELASALVDVAQERGYTLLVDQTNGHRETELLAAQGLREHLIDGLILSPLALRATDLAERDPNTPLVLLGEQTSAPATDHVAIDNVGAAADATHHLLGLGRRRIALLGAQAPGVSQMATLREEGYRRAHREAGVAVPEDLIRQTRWFLRSDGSEAMHALLESGAEFDGAFCLNDLVAVGALSTLGAHGVRVPDEVAVVGFDDIDEGRFHRPTLTSISPDKTAIARIALDSLLARMNENSGAPSRELSAPYHLAIRQSTVSGSTDGCSTRP